MNTRLAVPLFLALVACPRKIPEHLRPDGPETESPQQDLKTIQDLVAALVRTDPLGRASGGISPEQARAIPGGEAYGDLLEAAAALKPGAIGPLAELEALQQRFPGTALVALSRGARVREIESSLGSQTAVDEDTQGRILSLLTPLAANSGDRGLPLQPLHWLSTSGAVRGPVLTSADRWALLAWLDGPDIGVEPVAEALRSPPYDSLRRTAAGQLVLARAAGIVGPTERGLADLERAGAWLLIDAVSDNNRGQQKQAARWKALGEELGSDSPRDALLGRAELDLREVAGADLGAGGALMALQARRIWGRCPTEPCIGLDRVAGLRAAGRWDPRLTRIADQLQLAALVESIDGIDVARDTVRWHRATVDLVDALVGTGAQAPSSLVIRQRSPTPSTWLSLARSVGGSDATTWEEANAALRGFAAEKAMAMLNDERDPEIRRALQAVVDRVP